MPNTCYLHLGSNLGDKKANLAKALALIEQKLGVIRLKSSLYVTEAWGLSEQDSFLNQAIKLITPFDVYTVLAQIQMIEKAIGRKKTIKWGPRIIDIDILFYNRDIIRRKDLIVPHSHIAERKFVLAPLNEIASGFIHPVSKKSIKKMFDNCRDKSAYSILVDE